MNPPGFQEMVDALMVDGMLFGEAVLRAREHFAARLAPTPRIKPRQLPPPRNQKNALGGEAMTTGQSWPRIRAWFIRRHARRIASEMLAEGGVDAAQTACDAMFTLNRYAKHASEYDRWDIYLVKRRLIGELREQYPCTVTRAVHRLLCYSCEGTGIWSRWAHYADTCWKCNGTGVYREHELLLFAFSVGSERHLERYAWHQPRELWPTVVPIEGEPEGYSPPPPGTWKPLNDRLYRVLLETVAQWIEAQGFPRLSQPVLRAPDPLAWCVRHDIDDLLVRARLAIRWFFRALIRRLNDRVARMRGIEEETIDLPF